MDEQKHIDVIDYQLRMDGWRHTHTQEAFGDCEYCDAVAWIETRTYNHHAYDGYVEVVVCPVCSSAVRFDRE